MKNILFALALVLPFTVVTAAEIGGTKEPLMYIYCNGCPEKSHNEKFVDELTTEDAGIVVVWHPETNVPHRIIITSTTASPVQDVCETFKKFYPNLVTTISTHIGGTRTYRCDAKVSGGPTSLDVVGGPASLEVAVE